MHFLETSSSSTKSLPFLALFINLLLSSTALDHNEVTLKSISEPQQLLQQPLQQPLQQSENSWLYICETIHSAKFLIDASVSSHGCQLKCVVLESQHQPKKSDPPSPIIFDKSVTHTHDLIDGVTCKRDHVCSNGSCILDVSVDGQDKEGMLVIDIIDAYVPQKDYLTHSDTYVKVVIRNPSKDQIAPEKTTEKKTEENKKVSDAESVMKRLSFDPAVKVGKTKVVWDTERPVFNSTMKVENVSISSTIFFELFDKDMLDHDDFIASLYAALKTLLKEEKNHQIINLPFSNDYYLRVKISWIAYKA
jgi:hypothetical protein